MWIFGHLSRLCLSVFRGHRTFVADPTGVVAGDGTGHALSLTPATFGVGVSVSLLVAGVAVYRRRRRNAVGIEEGGEVAEVKLAPPIVATPGELGTVLYGRAEYVQVSATVLDLAERGHLHVRPLTIPEDVEDREWELELRAGRDALRGYEQILLDELGVRTGPERYPNLTNRSTRKVAAALYTEVARRGWFIDDPTRARRRAYGVASIEVLIGVLATIALAVFSTWAIIGLGFLLGSLGALAVANRGAVRTSEGQHLAADANAVRRGMSERTRDVDARYFAHAVALGMSAKLARSLRARGVEIPGWLTTTATTSVTWTSIGALALQGSRYGPSVTAGLSTNFSSGI